ncbi:putative Splicing factor u2af large subunit [Melia azedarach]|uniref:Splicing factor u2af large subunit n=1 Tax=Melia azedarach TaxID=155640 RepID=A0ACC1XGQ6_MELAZ|nr:putative Splicing factor u2af large subunit [Melia azedarach]
MIHEEPSHPSKGKSGRQYFDIDKSRVTSNGLSGHYRRYGGSTKGFSSYSPRKRRTEAVVKTPSSINHSSEKKRAKWDITPAEVSSVPSNAQTSNLAASSNALDVIQRKKGQALVEFLTLEDASAALSCDGCTFSGSILIFRCPKTLLKWP